MNDFDNKIISDVNKLLAKSHDVNKQHFADHYKQIENLIQYTLPEVLNKTTPKPCYWFPIVNSIVNGVTVGISVYLLFRLFS